MSETYPTRETMKRFSQDIYPSSVGIGHKVTTIFLITQTLNDVFCKMRLLLEVFIGYIGSKSSWNN